MSDFDSLSREQLLAIVKIINPPVPPKAKSNKTDMERISEGTWIYKQKESKNWYVRIHLPKNGIDNYRCTTKTDNKTKAIEFAIQTKIEAGIKIENGIPLKNRMLFKILANEVIEQYKKRNKANDGYYISLINNYLIAEFGSKNIDNVGRVEIRNWYLEQGEVSKTFANTINTCLNSIFRHAVDKKLISHAIDLKGLAQIKQSKKRLDFSNEEITEMHNKLDTWIEKSKTKKTKIKREMLKRYCVFLEKTGVRTGEELDNLLWREIKPYVHNVKDKKHTDYFSLIKAGKTKKYNEGGREIILSKSSEKTNIFSECLIPQANLHGFKTVKEALKSDLKVFEFDGIVPKFDDYFLRFKKEMDCFKEHVLYDFRHTYITRQILNDVPLPRIASQCGTSVKMIEKNYSHATNLKYRQKELEEK